jgi:hypothetical protein
MKPAMIGGVLAVVLAAAPQARAQDRKPGSEVWMFDRIENINGLPTTVLGHPRVIDTPWARRSNSMASMTLYSLANTRSLEPKGSFSKPYSGPIRVAPPSSAGFTSRNTATGKDTDTRSLFETRLIGDNWCLDVFVNTPAGNKALLDRSLLHPLGAWYHVAMVYDGTEFRSFVNGALQGKAVVPFIPEGKGRASVGVRTTA